MTKEIVRFGLVLTMAGVAGLSTVGCKNDPEKAVTPATNPATAPADGGGDSEPSTKPSTKPSTLPASVPGEAGADPLFTLPPSKGPAAHKFKQITLLREGPSGDMEMQLTGDGIYRLRGFSQQKSYLGNGKLTDEQIADWAALMSDWEKLDESYVADAAAKDIDKVEIMYGGKKVVFNPGKKNPAVVEEAYKRLLALGEKSQEPTAASGEPVVLPDNPFGDSPKK